jgi:hypothetical protein
MFAYTAVKFVLDPGPHFSNELVMETSVRRADVGRARQNGLLEAAWECSDLILNSAVVGIKAI